MTWLSPPLPQPRRLHPSIQLSGKVRSQNSKATHGSQAANLCRKQKKERQQRTRLGQGPQAAPEEAGSIGAAVRCPTLTNQGGAPGTATLRSTSSNRFLKYLQRKRRKILPRRQSRLRSLLGRATHWAQCPQLLAPASALPAPPRGCRLYVPVHQEAALTEAHNHPLGTTGRLQKRPLPTDWEGNTPILG